MTSQKNVVIGVTGGIAAYKSAEIASMLSKKGYDIHVIMTENAVKFVTPLTMRTISKNVVTVDMFENISNWNVQHVELAKWADAFLIAPASANFIGKVAAGIADDMLTTTVMATKAKVLIAPAMNCNMYLNPIVQENIEKLKKLGYIFIEPDSGPLACGDIGIGRLADIDSITRKVDDVLKRKKDLEGYTVLVTAGPTREPIDPVRFISNHSSGKMGYAIAESAHSRGAYVILVSGPTSINVPDCDELIRVETTEQMLNAVKSHYDEADIVIKAAAPSDFKPKKYYDQKIKKESMGTDSLSIELEKNTDILFELGKLKKKQVLIGFAAETTELIENAKGKLQRKNLDMIVANDVTMKGAGFGSDTNIVKLIERDGRISDIPKTTKTELADIILDEALNIENELR